MYIDCPKCRQLIVVEPAIVWVQDLPEIVVDICDECLKKDDKDVN